MINQKQFERIARLAYALGKARTTPPTSDDFTGLTTMALGEGLDESASEAFFLVMENLWVIGVSHYDRPESDQDFSKAVALSKKRTEETLGQSWEKLRQGDPQQSKTGFLNLLVSKLA